MSAGDPIGRLLAAPGVALAAGALEGEEVWLVGGIVRDALLGRPLADVDLAVHGDPEAAAKRLARAAGGPAFSLSDEFGTWRALGPDGTTFDVSPLAGGSIEADLARRDFTVNAMAVALAGGELIDPLGGRGDLEAARLRVAGPNAYADDALRPLRLVRFAAELGFGVEDETARLTRAAAPRLSGPAAERVFAELRRLVCAPAALRGLDLAADLGVLAAVLPEMVDLQGIDQSRFHHLDVYDHTREVLSRAIEIERDPAAVFGDLGPRVGEILSQPLADELTRGGALRFGALLHDIAKPATHATRPDGRPTFIGHDAEGEVMTRDILARLRTSERMRQFVSALTRHHLVLGFLVHETPLSRRAVHRYLRRCEPVEVEVTVLSCADRMATRGEGQESWIDAHLDLARHVMGAALEWRAHGPGEPPLRGGELASELGIEPGPEIGRLLAEIEAASFAGEVETREDALALARSLREDRPA